MSRVLDVEELDLALARAASTFDLRAALTSVSDLLQPRPRRYLLDFGATAVAGWCAFTGMVIFGPTSAVGLACWLMGAWLLYRSALFIHESVHLRRGAFARRFGAFWNSLAGFPLLIPRFLYQSHAEHHSKRLYGTSRDAEYLPFAQLPRSEIIRVMAASPLVALCGPIRFGVAAPVSWLLPPVRRWSWAHASAIKLDLSYEGRPPRPGTERRSWLLQEAVASVLCWSVIGLVITGVLPASVLWCWYLMVTLIVTVNSLRLLGAHRYHGNDDKADLVAQLIDTVNVTRYPWLAAVWGPIGLRLHALHHLVPSLPYHNYAEAHRRLMATLPPDSAYHLTEEKGLVAALQALWVRPRSAATEQHPGAERRSR